MQWQDEHLLTNIALPFSLITIGMFCEADGIAAAAGGREAGSNKDWMYMANASSNIVIRKPRNMYWTSLFMYKFTKQINFAYINYPLLIL
jgi:hypothetical protein